MLNMTVRLWRKIHDTNGVSTPGRRRSHPDLHQQIAARATQEQIIAVSTQQKVIAAIAPQRITARCAID